MNINHWVIELSERHSKPFIHCSFPKECTPTILLYIYIVHIKQNSHGAPRVRQLEKVKDAQLTLDRLWCGSGWVVAWFHWRSAEKAQSCTDLREKLFGNFGKQMPTYFGLFGVFVLERKGIKQRHLFIYIFIQTPWLKIRHSGRQLSMCDHVLLLNLFWAHGKAF